MIVLDRPQRTPNGAVALEARPKSDLPNTVAPMYRARALDVAEHVPAECISF